MAKTKHLRRADVLFWLSLARLLISVDLELALKDGVCSPPYELLVTYGLSAKTRMISRKNDNSRSTDIRIESLDALPALISTGQRDVRDGVRRTLFMLQAREFPSCSKALEHREEDRQLHDILLLKILSSLRASPFGASVFFPVFVRQSTQPIWRTAPVAVKSSLPSTFFVTNFMTK